MTVIEIGLFIVTGCCLLLLWMILSANGGLLEEIAALKKDNDRLRLENERLSNRCLEHNLEINGLEKLLAAERGRASK